MLAKDLMERDVMSVRDTDRVEDLLEALIGEHIHGAPVLDQEGGLVGVVTQQDLFFAPATQSTGSDAATAERPQPLLVREIMTAPAVSAEEDVDVRQLCRTMFELRIHRVPITRQGRLAGIVSSLDICAAVSNGVNL